MEKEAILIGDAYEFKCTCENDTRSGTIRIFTFKEWKDVSVSF